MVIECVKPSAHSTARKPAWWTRAEHNSGRGRHVLADRAFQVFSLYRMNCDPLVGAGITFHHGHLKGDLAHCPTKPPRHGAVKFDVVFAPIMGGGDLA